MSALVNGIRVLRCFSEEERELSLSEISRRLGLSKSNTHRIVSILTEEGLLERWPDSRRYRLGMQLFEMGSRVTNYLELGRLALPILTELNRITGETVHLGVLDGGEVVYLQKVESPRALKIGSAVGQRNPAHCTSTGKAILAWRTPSEIDRVIQRGLRAYTDRTITDGDALRKHLAEVRRLGYAVSDQEIEAWACSVGAPVRSPTGATIASISVAAPVQRLSRENFPAMAGLVIRAARKLAEELAR